MPEASKLVSFFVQILLTLNVKMEEAGDIPDANEIILIDSKKLVKVSCYYLLSFISFHGNPCISDQECLN